MRFQFSLEKALEWVGMEENAKRLEIASLMRARALTEQQRDEALARIASILEQPGRRLETAWVPFVADRVPREAEEAEAAEKDLMIQSQIESKKSDLSRILMKRKGLESLREKRHRDHRLKESRREQKSMDERFSMLKSWRKSG